MLHTLKLGADFSHLVEAQVIHGEKVYPRPGRQARRGKRHWHRRHRAGHSVPLPPHTMLAFTRRI